MSNGDREDRRERYRADREDLRESHREDREDARETRREDREDERELKRTPRYYARATQDLSALWLLLPLAIVLIMGAITILTLVPFKPYTFYGFGDLPDQICAGEQLVLPIDREISSLNDSYQVTVTANWHPVDDIDNPVTVNEVTVTMKPQLRGEVMAENVRSGPPTPGEYYAGATLKVRGFLYGFFPRAQYVSLFGYQVVKVLPANDASCLGAIEGRAQ